MKKLLAASLFIALFALPAIAQVDPKWEIHDRNRPNPPIVTSGTASTQDAPGKPPSDAIVLFDGRDLAQWQATDGTPSRCVVDGGEMLCRTGSGDAVNCSDTGVSAGRVIVVVLVATLSEVSGSTTPAGRRPAPSAPARAVPPVRWP